MADPTFDLGMTDEEFAEVSTDSPFVVIPPSNPDGVEREGDSILLSIEAGIPDWKTPGRSLLIPITVTESGINEGKEVEIYPGVSKDAISILKRLAVNLGVADKVFKSEDGKVTLNYLGFAGGKGKGRFIREKSNQGNLRSVLKTTNIFPADFSEPENLGI